MSLVLRSYQPTDADVITAWIKTEYQMRQWCADRYEHYPVMPEDMNTYHELFIDGHNSVALTMADGGDIVGYATLRIPDGNLAKRRLGFVIVNDSKRGKGLGKSLVRMAVDYAFRILGATQVSLGVFENNPAAIRCYESVGFQRIAKKEIESYECLGYRWNCIEMELCKQPTMETDRLVLRRWRIDDDKSLYKYASDERVSELALWPRHTSVEMSREVIEKIFIPNPQLFAMVLRATNEPIGCIGLIPEGTEHYATQPGRREIGYWIGYPYWGKGLTTEALGRFIEYCRNKLQLKSLLITNDVRNVASQRVAEKCGFEFIEDYEFDGIPSKAYRLS